jgi:hypothetical protein
MTVVAAMITDELIVCMGDGRVNSFKHVIVDDERVKMFALTPLAILLPANGAPDNIDEIMDILAEMFSKYDTKEVSGVMEMFIHYCEGNVEISDPKITPVFTLAGYDIEADVHVPKLYSIRFVDGRWRAYQPPEGENFILMGAMGPELRELIRGSGISSESTPMQADKVLLSVLAVAEEHAADMVGGKTTLWHLSPNELKKLTDQEIADLR